MEKARFLIRFIGRKPMLVVLVLSLLLTTALLWVAPSRADETDEQKTARQVAQNWIQVGMEQYQRGLLAAAVQSYLMAQDYQEYLTAAERRNLDELLEKTRKKIAAIERKRILEFIQKANKLVEKDKLIEAKASLESVRDNKFLTEQEQKLITEGLEKIDNQLSQQRKDVAELYNRSERFYRSGQLEKAREGFVEVAGNSLLLGQTETTAEDYIAKIDSELQEQRRLEAQKKLEEQRKSEAQKKLEEQRELEAQKKLEEQRELEAQKKMEEWSKLVQQRKLLLAEQKK